MLRIFVLLSTIMLAGTAADRARAHDLPASMHVRGFFDTRAPAPELVLRVPLIMLTNINLPKRGPGYLDLANLGGAVERAEGAIAAAFQIRTEGRPIAPAEVASRISLPSEWSFDDPETARAAIAGPALPESQNIFWNQGFLDIRLIYGAEAAGRTYALGTDLPPGMAERVLISIGVVASETPVRTLRISGAIRDIDLNPRWHRAGMIFMTKGVETILTGYDHLLFLLCLILPLRRQGRRLLMVVTAFAVGHSMTLIPTALGMVPAAGWFAPTIETLIAASIVYLAIENILGGGSRFRSGLAFGFGLIHGVGFAGALTDALQFSGGHLIASLVFFNIGIEIGQVVALAALLAGLALLLRTDRSQRVGVILISVLAGHEGWHWMTQRLAQVDAAPMTAFGSGESVSVVIWVGLGLVLALAALGTAASPGWKGDDRRPAPVRTTGHGNPQPGEFQR